MSASSPAAGPTLWLLRHAPVLAAPGLCYGRTDLPADPAATHRAAGEQILLANPLGYGLAEIDSTPERSRLRTADGKESESSDPDALIEDLTGLRLPVARLPGWLTGRAAGDARLEADPFGRPARLNEAGWQVDYFYDDNRPDALPARLHISRPGEIELKLRIEEWRALP